MASESNPARVSSTAGAGDRPVSGHLMGRNTTKLLNAIAAGDTSLWDEGDDDTDRGDRFSHKPQSPD